MTKKHFFKKQKQSSTKERILWVIIFILVAIQAITSWYLITLWNRHDDTSRLTGNLYFSWISERYYKDPVIDIAGNRVYIPEARVYLPLNETTRDMQYRYTNIPGRVVTLSLSTSSIIGRTTSENPLPCDGLVSLSQTKERASDNLFATIQPTKDGLRYIYTPQTCVTQYSKPTQEALAKAAETMTQY